jgi:hypothetical protein
MSITHRTNTESVWAKLKLTGMAAALSFIMTLVLAGCPVEPDPESGGGNDFVAVTGISGVPTQAEVDTALPLTGIVAPANATNQTIAWKVKTGTGTTAPGAAIADGNLKAEGPGDVTVTAAIAMGKSDTEDFTRDFTITVYAAGTLPTVDSVTVSPSTASVQKGETLQFNAMVEGTNSPSQMVSWSITTAGVKRGTSISESGLLTVAADETLGAALTIKAVSNADNTKSGSVMVTVTGADPVVPTVNWLTVSPETERVAKGSNQTFIAAVKGTNNPPKTVTWSIVQTGKKEGTAISEGGVLTVASDEMLTSLTIKAVSNADNTMYDTATVSVIEAPPPIPIEELAAHVAGLPENVDVYPEYPHLVKLAMTNIMANGVMGSINQAVTSRYVILDLSACYATNNTISGVRNNPGSNDMNVIRRNRYIVGIILPDSLTAIGELAFYACWYPTRIDIPGSVTSIGSEAFTGCGSLVSVIIPEGVTSIRGSTFSGCESLTSVVIPASVTLFYAGAFAGCSSLTSVTIPANLHHNSISAFSTAEIVWTVTGSGGNWTTSRNGALLIYNGDTLLYNGDTVYNGDTLVYGRAASGSVTIPDSVTSIDGSAFYECTSLTSITIPGSVTSIGAYAFQGCTGLTSVTFAPGSNISEADFEAGYYGGSTFPGDLREKYLSGGAGTYTRPLPLTDPGTTGTWTKQ